MIFLVGGDDRSEITSVTSAYDTHISDTASEAPSEQDSGIGSITPGGLEKNRKHHKIKEEKVISSHHGEHPEEASQSFS